VKRNHYLKSPRKMRHDRVRSKVSGTAERPRLNVFRSLEHIYAQIIDDVQGHTIVAANSLEPALRGQTASMKKTEAATLVGRTLAERAVAQGISKIAFDRGGYLYHGRVQALADGAREGGLDF